MASTKASFNWEDPLLLDLQLSETERMVRDAARAYCQDKLMPRVQEAFRHERTDASIFREMGELGLLGATIPFLGIDYAKVQDSIREIFQRKGDAIVELNLKALAAGKEIAEKLM